MEVREKSVLCEDKEGNRFEIQADAVISAGGMRPREELVEELRDTVIDFAWIGDCYAPGLIRTAVEMGYHTALDI